MPSRPPKVCAAPGCYNKTDKGRCSACTPKHHRQRDSQRGNSTQRGYDNRWRKFRSSFLKQNPLCVHCKKEGRIEAATEVDHIIPHRGDMTLFWQEGNHQGLCKSHHSMKTAAGH